jgi:hypothetical protein
VRHVTIRPIVAFTIGDAKSGDFITGRYGGHNTKRMCRACYCPYGQSDQTEHHCVFVKEEDMTPFLNVTRHYHDGVTHRDSKWRDITLLASKMGHPPCMSEEDSARELYSGWHDWVMAHYDPEDRDPFVAGPDVGHRDSCAQVTRLYGIDEEVLTHVHATGTHRGLVITRPGIWPAKVIAVLMFEEQLVVQTANKIPRKICRLVGAEKSGIAGKLEFLPDSTLLCSVTPVPTN